MSYNLLAPLFVRVPGKPFSYFEHASARAVAWDTRRAKIIEILDAASADVVCLQEVQYERVEPTPGEPTWVPPAWVRSVADQLGYYPVAMPLAPKDWRRQAQRNVRATGRLGCTGLMTLVRAAPALIRSSRSLIVRFTAGGAAYTIANVHLEGHPDRGPERARQLEGALASARSDAATHVVIAGDWNSRLPEDTPVAAFIAAREERMTRVDTGPTWCGAPGQPAAIDHVLHDRTVRLRGVRVALTKADIAAGMPNEDSPSDHAPVYVDLDPVAPPYPSGPPDPPTPAPAALAAQEAARLDEAWRRLMAQAPPTPRGPPSDEERAALTAFKARKKAFLAGLPSDAHRRHLRRR